jgi:autotransporter-associated beta strand protein
VAEALSRRGEPGAGEFWGVAARGVCAALCAALSVGLAARAGAAEFTVTSTADSGTGSLREAIGNANASADASNTILFDLPADSTIALTTALPNIATNELVIDGSGAANLAIQGFDPAQTFLQNSSASLTLIDLRPENGDVAIGEVQALTFETTSDLEVATDLVDAATTPVFGGELVKDGAAMLTLRGTNTYSGGTTVNDGTLRGDTSSLQRDIEVAGGAALIFDQIDSDDTYDGAISGRGSVEKTGAYQVTFTADHDYTGGTTVSEGTLYVSGALPADGDITVASGATLELEPAADFALAGALDGAGALVTHGDGIAIELDGGGAFSGPITINDGALTDASGVIRGNVTLVTTSAEPELRFDVASAQTLNGNITGTGQVSKLGAGTLTLLGSNSFAPSNPLVDAAFHLEEGTLVGTSSSLQGDIETGIVEDATLIFDQSFSGTYSGDVFSSGLADLAFEKRGSGTLTIARTVEASGGATISGGSLIVVGAGAGTLDTSGATTTVAAGATLGGSGDVWGTTMVAGRVAPQGPGAQDSLTLEDVIFEPGSTFEVNIDSMSNADYLDVMNSADVGAGTLEVNLAPGDYSAGSTALILSSGGLTGVFQLDNSLAFLDESLAVMGDKLWLTVISNANTMSSFATTPNQTKVAGVLEAEQPMASGDLGEVFDRIALLHKDEVAPLLDAVGGESLTAFPTLWREASLRFERAVHRRVRDAGWGAEAPLASFADGGAPRALPEAAAWPGAPTLPSVGAGGPLGQAREGLRGPAGFQSFESASGVGAWLDAFGVLGRLDGDGNSAQLDYDLYGGSAGLDYAVSEHIVAGVAAGYAHADADLDQRAGDGNVDTAQAALYAGYVDPRFYASASGHYAYAWNDSRRRIGFGIDRSASAHFTSRNAGARGELGVHALRVAGVDFTPSAAVDWSRLSRAGFGESGAGSLDLEVERDTLDSLVSSLGGRASGVVEISEGVRMQPELHAYWLHEFGDRERSIAARLQGAVASSRFEILGAEVPQDWILAGGGWSVSVGDALRVSASYDVGVSGALLQHEATLTARFQF